MIYILLYFWCLIDSDRRWWYDGSGSRLKRGFYNLKMRTRKVDGKRRRLTGREDRRVMVDE
jgi:hypothetical protein